LQVPEKSEKMECGYQLYTNHSTYLNTPKSIDYTIYFLFNHGDVTGDIQNLNPTWVDPSTLESTLQPQTTNTWNDEIKPYHP